MRLTHRINVPLLAACNLIRCTHALRGQVVAGGEVLDEADFVSLVVVGHLIDEAARHHDAEASFADAERFADHHVAQGIIRRGGVGQVFRIESGAGVLDVDGNLLRVNPVIDGDDPFRLASCAPLDGVGAELADGRRKLFHLLLRQTAEEKQRAEQVVELFEIVRVALQMKTNLPLGAVLLEIFKPVERRSESRG